jgi:hypothetical protein
MTDVVVYVLGERNKPERAWQNAHPRDKRTDTTLEFFDYVAEKRKTWFKWIGDLPPKGAPDNTVDIGSVLDLYDFIKAAKRQSVIELHFFTHGWEGGPTLYNTNDYELDQDKRDPDDKDPRIKDFSINDVLGGTERAKFAGAFASSALVKLWGCNYPEETNYRYMLLNEFYGRKATDDTKKAFKQRYQTFIRQSTYQYHLAVATGLPIYAAPLGYGSNPYAPFGYYGNAAKKAKKKWRGVYPPKRGDQWWCVSPFFRPDRGREFYERELGCRVDILDYVAYTPAMAP